MPKTEYIEPHFRITHTVEKTGPHPTIPYDFYEDTFVITIILHGKGTCYIEGNNYPLSDGDIVVMTPDDIHSYNFVQSGYHERISIYLSSAVLAGLGEYELSLVQLFRTPTGNAKYIYSNTDYNKEILLPLLDRMCETIGNTELAMQSARIYLMLIQLLFLLYDSKNNISPQTENSTEDTAVGELCRYIKEHLQEDLSYKAIQKRFFLSRYELTKKFQYHTGMTLTEYIINKRLMRVISLVRNGEGIESAVYASGFNTYSHFYKEFVKHFNISPREYFGTNR